MALPPPIIPADGQEATADTLANHEEAMAQLPHIVHKPPQIGEPSPKGTMPTLLPLPASGITPAENRCYPEQRNWSPYFTPPKVINASSLGKRHDMTPLDVRSPDGATLEQVLYAEKKKLGRTMPPTISAAETSIQRMVIFIVIPVTMKLMMMVASLVSWRL
jgi:hypothetical protein